MTIEKFIYYTIGGIIGGGVGWTVGQVLQYQFFEKPYDEILDEPEEKEFGFRPALGKDDAPGYDRQGVRKKAGKIIPNSIEEAKENMLTGKNFGQPAVIETSQTVVTEEMFSKNPIGYKLRHFVYYEKDDTLVGEDDSPEEVMPTIGDKALECFGQSSDDPDVVFIQNDQTRTIYEVILLKERSYNEDILGLPAEEEEVRQKYERKKKKKARSEDLEEADNK